MSVGPRRGRHAGSGVRPPGPVAIAIFGGSGDLTWRKLVPALYNLFLDGWLPERFAVLGVDRRSFDDAGYRDHLRQGVDEFSRRGRADDARWHAFAQRVQFLSLDFADRGAPDALAERLRAVDAALGGRAARVCYFAVPPTLVGTIAERLGSAMSRGHDEVRVVVEKPYGRDLASAQALTRTLTRAFSERQIYRIDHYLGKETVQNILAFRFANSMFEPIWSRRYIDHVQITVAEEVGVEHRGGYYEGAGALRDMVQNHLLQLVCLIAMEPPLSFNGDEIRNKKVDVLHAIRPIDPDRAGDSAVRGQYAAGVAEGEPVPGYRQEPGVAPDSTTETFAAVKFFVDNWRWERVPFYLRTGKRLPAKASEISIQFLPAPHQMFPPAAIPHWQPNRLAVRVQPSEGIALRFQAKQPGLVLRLDPVDMVFSYADAFRMPSPEAYETLLLDVMRGDPTLFMRDDQVDAAWSVVAPILDAWAAEKSADLPNYAAGTWGPEAADELLRRDDRRWILPTALEPSEPDAP